MIRSLITDLLDRALEPPGLALMDPWHFLSGVSDYPGMRAAFNQYSYFPMQDFLTTGFQDSLNKRVTIRSHRYNAQYRGTASSVHTYIEKFMRTLGIDSGCKDSKLFGFLAENGTAANRNLFDLVRIIEARKRSEGQHWRSIIACSNVAHGTPLALKEEYPERYLPIEIHSNNGFQIDDTELSHHLVSKCAPQMSTESDVAVLKLTAPTTDLNTIESIGPLSEAEIVKRDIWVHVDCCVGANVLLLTNAARIKLAELLRKPWVRSFTIDTHKLLGMPTAGILCLKRKKDADVMRSLSPRYFNSSAGIGGTSINVGSMAETYYRVEALGSKGVRYLAHSAYHAAKTLGSCMEQEGFSLVTQPNMRSLVVKLSSEEETDLILHAYMNHLCWPLAKVHLRTHESEIHGVRIVIPIGIAWTRESLQYFARTFKEVHEQALLGKQVAFHDSHYAQVMNQGKNLLMRCGPFPQNPGKHQLIEIPSHWLDHYQEMTWIRDDPRSEIPVEEIISTIPYWYRPWPSRFLRRQAKKTGTGYKIRLANVSEMFA